jgi:hypothetical protein
MLKMAAETAAHTSFDIARGAADRPSRSASTKQLTRSIDDPWPFFCARAEASYDRILPDVIDLGLQLLPALVIAQSMIEEALLPFDPILSSVKMFPIANDTAHRSAERPAARERDRA